MSGCDTEISLQIPEGSTISLHLGSPGLQINTQLPYSSRKKETFNRVSGIGREKDCDIPPLQRTQNIRLVKATEALGGHLYKASKEVRHGKKGGEETWGRK